MLFSYGANFVDPRGKLLARSYDLLGTVVHFPLLYMRIPSPLARFECSFNISAGLYSTFVFQKPDPDVVPPIMTPMLQDGNHAHEEASFRTLRIMFQAFQL